MRPQEDFTRRTIPLAHAVAAAAVMLSLATAARADPACPVPETNMTVSFATAPTMRFPEGVLVIDTNVYVSGPADFATANTPPSTIHVFDLQSGTLLDVIDIQGQDLAREHALVAMAADNAKRIYVVETQQGILRIDPYTHAQQVYAPALPVLPRCADVPAGTPCAPVAAVRGPLPNDIAFDRAGYLYLTDSFQATIWRIPPGGGAPQIWFQDARLDAPDSFGPNGIRLHPSREEMWFVHTGPPSVLYALPTIAAPTAADLRWLASFGYGGADGIAFGQYADIYVGLAFVNQLALFSIDDLICFQGPAPEVNASLPMPWDAPAGIAFTGRGDVLVVDHALLSRDPSHFAVLSVPVRDPGWPIYRPHIVP